MPRLGARFLRSTQKQGRNHKGRHGTPGRRGEVQKDISRRQPAGSYRSTLDTNTVLTLKLRPRNSCYREQPKGLASVCYLAVRAFQPSASRRDPFYPGMIITGNPERRASTDLVAASDAPDGRAGDGSTYGLAGVSGGFDSEGFPELTQLHPKKSQNRIEIRRAGYVTYHPANRVEFHVRLWQTGTGGVAGPLLVPGKAEYFLVEEILVNVEV